MDGKKLVGRMGGCKEVTHRKTVIIIITKEGRRRRKERGRNEINIKGKRSPRAGV